MYLYRTDEISLIVMMDLAVAGMDKWISLSRIAGKHGSSVAFLKKIVRPLVRAGLVESREGKNGGYRLARNCTDITCWDILSAATEKLDDPSRKYLNRMVCPLDEKCTAQKAHKAIQDLLEKSLSSAHLSSLI